jgi:hypothetical protein
MCRLNFPKKSTTVPNRSAKAVERREVRIGKCFFVVNEHEELVFAIIEEIQLNIFRPFVKGS